MNWPRQQGSICPPWWLDVCDEQGVLILADGYPANRTPVDPAVLAEAARKKLRVYVEYPESLPDLKLDPPTAISKAALPGLPSSPQPGHCDSLALRYRLTLTAKSVRGRSSSG